MPQVSLQLQTLRLENALRSVIELPDKDRLVIHLDQYLVVVPWSRLKQSPSLGPQAVLPPGPGRILAENVAVDNAVALNPKNNHILLATNGEIVDIDPLDKKISDQKIAVAGLSESTFAASVDPAGQKSIFAVVRNVNFDFSEYAVISVDLATGKLIPEATLGSNADLEFIWDAKIRGWFIGDTSRAFAWRWDTTSPAVKLQPPPADPMIAATFASTPDGILISALVTTKNGTPALTLGRADKDRITWTPPAPLPGGSVTFARRHPTRPIWACLADEKSGQQVQIRDAAGKLLAAATVRSATLLNNLRWSAYAPDRIWGSGFRALAEIIIKEGGNDPAPDLKSPLK